MLTTVNTVNAVNANKKAALLMFAAAALSDMARSPDSSGFPGAHRGAI
jgi:hypothetical protein